LAWFTGRLFAALLLVKRALALLVLCFAGCSSSNNAPAPTAGPGPAATPAVGATVITTTTTNLGVFLTDSTGRSLYLFQLDTPGNSASTCYDACASAWPPLTLATGRSLLAVDGVQQSLLGTLKRSDGTTQGTYGGWPLYYYLGDTYPGQTNGQGVSQFGALWYLLTTEGKPLH
jgi:predicted lipoprotein with Yx(FWY)xxD motif